MAYRSINSGQHCISKRTFHTLRQRVGCRLVGLLFLIGLPTLSISQPIPPHCILSYDSVLLTVDSALFQSVRTTLGNDTLSLAYCKAISCYPELQGLKIRVKYKRITTSMAATPGVLSVIFRKPAKRTYFIYVNKNKESDRARLVATAPFNAQVGVFGHELAHILDYSQKSGWQVTRLGMRYLRKKNRGAIEHQTDSTAMAHGLDWQVYHYTYFVFNEADISDKYRRYKQEVYMSEEEMLGRILSKANRLAEDPS